MRAARFLWSTLVAGAFCLGGAEATIAQSYPARPIKLVVPFPPGGPTDVTARLIAERLSASLGQSVVVENRPGGAGGTVGVKAVASAEPDGYTLLFTSPGPLTISPAVYASLGYDPLKNFIPIAMVSTSPQLLVINPAVPARSIPEFVAYARANPGKVNFASPGYATQPHLIGELFKARSGLDIVHVPYKGSAPAITDLLAGQVQMLFDAPTAIIAHIRDGKLRLLGVATHGRSALLPEVPTMAEGGLDGFVASYWNGVVAPAGTPAGIVAKLNADINQVLKSAELRESLARLAAEPSIGSPQDFAAFLATELQKWAEVAKSAQIKVD